MSKLLPLLNPTAVPMKGSHFMTKAKLTGLLTSLVLLAVAVLPGRAAEPTPHPYVVLVGISQYADPQIKPRPHAEADVKALRRLRSRVRPRSRAARLCGASR